MKNIAVLTGDIVGSRKVNNIEDLMGVLKRVFADIKKDTSIVFEAEIYRGDSFQIVILNPKDALLFAVLVRVGLKAKTIVKPNSNSIPIYKLWDARIAIGIGEAVIKSKIIESNGEAFQLSGLEFDKLEKERGKLNILTVWKDENTTFNIIVKLLSIIIDKWTKLTSEVVYEYLLKNKTQSEMAKQLGISQPAIHKRLSIANMDVIENSINYISSKIVLENS